MWGFVKPAGVTFTEPTCVGSFDFFGICWEEPDLSGGWLDCMMGLIMPRLEIVILFSSKFEEIAGE